MKKKIVLLLGAIAVIVLTWSAITGQRQQSYAEAELRDQDKIWIITDLHYLSQDLFDDGEAFSYIEKQLLVRIYVMEKSGWRLWLSRLSVSNRPYY